MKHRCNNYNLSEFWCFCVCVCVLVEGIRPGPRLLGTIFKPSVVDLKLNPLKV